MGAQRAIFAVDAADPEPLKYKADQAQSEPHCQLVTTGGDNRLDIGSALEPSEEAIRLRSQQIWEREGCPEGYAEDHWMRARAELAALMEKTSNAHLAEPTRPKDEVTQPILVQANTIVPVASQSTESAAAPDSQGEVLYKDFEKDPKALMRQDVTFSCTRDESVSASPRPLSLSLTKRPKQSCDMPSIICAGIVLRGTLESTGDIQFDGCIEGTICSASLVVDEDAVVQGEAIAYDVTVRGRIQGRIRAYKVLLCSGSRVEGDILYGTLAVETGAQLDGSFQHREDPLAQVLLPEKTDFFTTQHALSAVITEADAATRRPEASEDAGATGALSQEKLLSQSAA
jgi:cytoskeletal protein CcmA (bactofilin family)